MTSAAKYTMASSTSLNQNGGPDHIVRPRPVKPNNPMLLRGQSGEGSLRPSAHIDTVLSSASRYAGHQVLVEETLLNTCQRPFHSST